MARSSAWLAQQQDCNFDNFAFSKPITLEKKQIHQPNSFRPDVYIRGADSEAAVCWEAALDRSEATEVVRFWTIDALVAARMAERSLQSVGSGEPATSSLADENTLPSCLNDMAYIATSVVRYSRPVSYAFACKKDGASVFRCSRNYNKLVKTQW